MAEPELHIIFEDVWYAYGDEIQRPALEGAELSVRPGEFVAVVGANGSGKSTLSKMINALITPEKGRVLTLGLDTAEEDEELLFEIRSQAGLVLQNPDSQIVASMVSDDVAFGPENLAVPHAQIVERVDEALDSVKMTSYANADPGNLSGGQKQRVCIAGLLAMRPRILVLDEPGAMLDVRGRRGIRRVLGELHQAGLTVVLVTHFMEEAALAERVLVMNEGKVVLQGSPREVFSHGPMLRSMGLDVPFSVQLAYALRERGVSVPDIASPRELKEVISNVALSQNLRNEQHGLNLQEYDGLPSSDIGERSMQSLISFENVSFYYPSSNVRGEKLPALRDINFCLEKGELLGVIGHTGSGKTTLLRMIAGLLFASSGTVHVAGTQLKKSRKRTSLHTKVGMVFQYPERQLFAPTVAEDVAFGPLNAGFDKETVQRKVRAALAHMELDYEEFAERSPFELSGGEKRRVAIAGILAMDPEVLIFDEPTAGLDAQGQQDARVLLNTLRARGKTIILTSHSLDMIAQLASTVAVLDKGELVMWGKPEEVFCRVHEPYLKRINLGLPQAAEFARELEERGLALPEGLLTLDALADAVAGALEGSVTNGRFHPDTLGGDQHGA